MRIILSVMALMACAVHPLSGTTDNSPVKISGLICLDPELLIPRDGQRVTITLQDRKWRPVARTNILIRPKETRIPWSLSVKQPDHYPGRLNLGYRISEETGAHGQGWWSPEGTVYDRRAAGQILLGNGRQSHIRICLLHGIAIHGRVFLPADVSAARQPVGIRLVDQSGRSRGIRWYRPVPKTRSVDWSRSWPPQTAPERVRIAVIMGSGNKRITLWARGTGLTSDPALADEYALAGKHPVCLIFP